MPTIAQLEQLLSIDPDDPFVHYGLGQELAKAGKLDQALSCYTRVIELDPTYCYAYYFKGQTLDELGRSDEAKRVIQAGIAAARQINDGHAASELTELLESLA